jgi:probable rRNA maturation factor
VIEVAVTNEQPSLVIDEERLRAAVELIVSESEIGQATISVAIVDDATIHDLNRRFLQHDYPTDVLSFVLEQTEDRLDGEVIASAEYAIRSAPEYNWPAPDELLLYVIHGTLHLVGYDDLDDNSRVKMRERERHYLLKCGVTPRETV